MPNIYRGSDFISRSREPCARGTGVKEEEDQKKITMKKKTHTHTHIHVKETTIFPSLLPFGKNEGTQSVAEGNDVISSQNPELCQRQWLAIYQHASLLEHSLRNSGHCGDSACENTPFILRSIYMQITCGKKPGVDFRLLYYHK